MNSTILIVDDDPVQRRLLEAMIKRLGYGVEFCENGIEAIERLTGKNSTIDLVILDLVMPELDGMGVLTRLKLQGIDVPVIVQTAYGSIESVVSAMRAGADDFIVKPVGFERLQVSIRNGLRTSALQTEMRHVTRRLEGALTFRDIVTRSDEMARVIRLGERAAKSTIPVLLEGESGVGKELIARAIQGSSDRRGKPFITVNCGALPENLVESILFGHEKGAFTGAHERRNGKFMEANGGTLFLDEVGELPMETQVKLLRALQEGEIDPIGAKRSIKVDFRLVSATNKNLIELVKKGQFREDLYYRLNVFPINVPPLRNRKDDIPALSTRFAARIASEEGKPAKSIALEAQRLLRHYHWPGNVRQLENAIFRAIVLADGDELTLAEFPQIAAQVDGVDVNIPPVPALTSAVQPREIVRIEVRDPHVLSLLDENGDVRKLEEMEAEIIRFALIHYRSQMSEIARKLGIGRSTLYRKMNDFNLEENIGRTVPTLIGTSTDAA